MTASLDSIELPDDIQWIDELASWKVGQSITPSLTGALIIQEGALQAGRPITLQSVRDGNNYSAVVTRATVDALLAKAALAGGADMTLTLLDTTAGTRTFAVRFRHGDGAAVEAEPMRHIAPAELTDYYTITLRLLQV